MRYTQAIMFWSVVIAILVAGALAYGYWDHTRQSRHLSKLFAEVAARHGGDVKRANLLALPQLRFEVDGEPCLVSAMPGSGESNSGPFTFADITLSFDTGRSFRITRINKSVADGLEKLADSVAGRARSKTGDMAFDDVFQLRGTDQAYAAQLLNAETRTKLLNTTLVQPEVRLNSRKLSVHTDGISGTLPEIEALIEIAALLAKNAPGR